MWHSELKIHTAKTEGSAKKFCKFYFPLEHWKMISLLLWVLYIVSIFKIMYTKLKNHNK